ncbi:glycoside hydrolase family 3 N-terminal domain-containing protein [Catellatospora sp. KI3]|uniref:glycoside hydrolase family 3 protein n=1 Tax=Catellatospora sp. KI3 TaxID=3041620 RepID=UPI00248253B0|nr:glycoside hydrolase family 3 N-terminal domain-containing protein [Catellatospora sp. KI3]MDI1464725.1 glycoside hydrolase family 3 N-terminal domain-containing protein [Catellatospora sp. KI3]
MTQLDSDLALLADTVLQPGFVGTSAPDWVRRRLGRGLGGVALYSRNVADREQTAELTAQLRAENPDVVIAIDEEAGDVTRLDARTGSDRPGNLALGAVDDPDLTEAVARDIGADLAAVGITLNYAPTVDVNSRPENVVIGVRSFGADPALVARHSAAWVRGLQAAGVAACAKHFPGHGDTVEDSHFDAARVHASREELAATALPPFTAAIAAGVRAIMTGHLLVTAYDEELPATLSPVLLTGLLRERLGFQGLIVTDGIEMAAVARQWGVGGAAVRALAAGADAICVGGEYKNEGIVGLLRNSIVTAVREGALAQERLADAAARVRALARWGREAAADLGRTPEVGLAAARRAVRVTGSGLPLAGPAHVVELDTPTGIAVDQSMPWGVAGPLAALLAGTTTGRVGPEPEPDWLDAALAAADGRALVVVGRDAARHPWARQARARLLAARPDAVVVELGMPEPEPVGSVYVVTHGGTRACGRAAAEVLTGRH